MNNHPERMILIAVLVAAVLGLIGSAVSCAVLVPTISKMQSASSTYPSNPEWWLEQHPEYLGDEYGGLPEGSGSESSSTYTESDLPAKMEIGEEELRDDLEAFIDIDLRRYAGDSRGSKDSSSTATSTAKVTKLVLESTTDPRLVNGQILSEAKGKATIEYGDKSAEVDFTSYYYCENPHASKLIWYIYGYELGDYSLFPKDFGNTAGDPYQMLDWMLEGGATSGSSANFSRDNRHNAEAA